MVKPELLLLSKGLPPAITYRRATVEVKEIERAKNGAWFVVADLDFTFTLRDGRKVTATKQVRIRGQQTGTKPHKGGFQKKKDR